MAKIDRYDGNLEAFGSGSIGTERTVFGDTSQSDIITANVTPEYLRGWATVPVGGKPALEWFNGAMFTATQLLSYLHQMGVAEWDDSQEYYIGSLTTGSDGLQYRSKTSSNIGNNPVTDSGTNWINDVEGLQDNIDAEESARISADSAHASLTSAHGASATPTANSIVRRDAGSRIESSAAIGSADVVNAGQFGINVGAGQGRIFLPVWSGSAVLTATLQWKNVALPNNASVAHTFAYAFSTACVAVLITRSAGFDSYNEESGVAYSGASTTGCTLYSQMATNAMVVAIGY